MEYPKEVQSYVKVLDEYEESNTIETFNILHMYSGDLAYPDGYWHARWFELVGYNTEQMQKRNFGIHDRLSFENGVKVGGIEIFADGATLISFNNFVCIGDTQAASVYVPFDYCKADRITPMQNE